jgi:hypothetical protein
MGQEPSLRGGEFDGESALARDFRRHCAGVGREEPFCTEVGQEGVIRETIPIRRCACRGENSYARARHSRGKEE